jgi:hypothetical protein
MIKENINILTFKLFLRIFALKILDKYSMSALVLILVLIKFVDHMLFFENFPNIFDRIQKLSSKSNLYENNLKFWKIKL